MCLIVCTQIMFREKMEVVYVKDQIVENEDMKKKLLQKEYAMSNSSSIGTATYYKTELLAITRGLRAIIEEMLKHFGE